MATENTVMAAVLTPGETTIGNAACEPHVQDLCRFLVSLGAEIEGHRVERPADPRRRTPARRGLVDRARAHRGRQLHRPRRRHEQRPDDRRGRDQGPGLDPHGVHPARDRGGAGRRLGARAAAPGARDPERSRRPGAEDRRRAVARVPGRPDVDRRRRGDAGVGDDPRLREDVREPAVLRRQARLDGRADHRLRPAPRRRERAVAPLRAAADEPGHPRRDGDAHRCALRRRPVGDRQRRGDRPRLRADRRPPPRASARRSSASRPSRRYAPQG